MLHSSNAIETRRIPQRDPIVIRGPEWLVASRAMLLFIMSVIQQAPQDTARAPAPGSFALGIGLGHTGVSLGNSRRWNGIRVNFRDAGVDRVNGVLLTLWKARQGGNRDARYTGLSLGLVGPEGGRLRGINLGVIGVLAYRDMTGLNIGGGGLVSEGAVRGLSVGGLGIYARTGIQGATAAPLAVVSRGNIAGVTVGGLGIVSGGDLKGLNIGGLGIYARGKVAGVSVAPLGIVGRDQILGLNLSAIAVSGRGRVGGLSVAGLVVSSAASVEGIAMAGYRVETPTLRGLSIAPYNRIRGDQHGITIGILNHARELHGLQLGLINHAGNNPGPLRWLPLLNFHH